MIPFGGSRKGTQLLELAFEILLMKPQLTVDTASRKSILPSIFSLGTHRK